MLSTKENFVIQISKYTTFAVIQSPSHARLFATPWTAARQTFLSFTISSSLPEFMSVASMMLSSHLIL